MTREEEKRRALDDGHLSCEELLHGVVVVGPVVGKWDVVATTRTDTVHRGGDMLTTDDTARGEE